jgi:hypothetical protein
VAVSIGSLLSNTPGSDARRHHHSRGNQLSRIGVVITGVASGVLYRPTVPKHRTALSQSRMTRVTS